MHLKNCDIDFEKQLITHNKFWQANKLQVWLDKKIKGIQINPQFKLTCNQ